MKKLLALMLLACCQHSQGRCQEKPETNKLIMELKTTLPADPLYSSLLEDSWAFLDRAGAGLKSAQFLSEDTENQSYFVELKKIQPDDPAASRSVLLKYFDNADELMGIISRQQEKLKEFKEKYPGLFLLTQTDRAGVLAAAAEMYYESEQNSAYRFAPGDISNGPGDGRCEEQRFNDRARCRRNARLESASCSLLSQTLVGALICGGIVLMHERNCLQDAQIDYLVCLASN